MYAAWFDMISCHSWCSTRFVLRITLWSLLCFLLLILWGEKRVLDSLEHEQHHNTHVNLVNGFFFNHDHGHGSSSNVKRRFISEVKAFGEEAERDRVTKLHTGDSTSRAIPVDNVTGVSTKKSVATRNRIKNILEDKGQIIKFPQRNQIRPDENYIDKLYATGNLPNDEQIAFDIAKLRYQEHQQFQATNETRYSLEGYNFSGRKRTRHTAKVNMIRIPKAGSSYLSITGRALAGCKPDGFPCCQQPYDDCPFNSTQCGALRGCLDHYPSYRGNMPIITQLREPSSRLLSGFFYGSGTHNDNDGCYKWACFKTYIEDRRFQNVLTKILSGVLPYMPSGAGTVERMVTPAKQQLCKLAWFGMLEMTIPSNLLLYESGIFKTLIPNPVVFDLPPVDDMENAIFWNQAQHNHDKNGRNDWKKYIRDSQENKNKLKYDTFVNVEYQKKNGIDLIKSFNKEDYDVYDFATELFCARLRDVGLIHLASQFHKKYHFDGCLNASWTGSAAALCQSIDD